MEGIGNNNASPVGYYIPIAQSDVANGVRIAVRTNGDPAAATAFVRSAVASLDPDLAIYEINTLRWIIDRQTWFYTVFGTFFMAFGFCALFLAAAGLYGVMSFCGHAAHARDGRALGARRAGPSARRARDAQEPRAAGHRPLPRPGTRAARVGRAAAGPLSRATRAIPSCWRSCSPRWRSRACSPACCRRGA